ncbi:MAG: LTA synthase family protein [Ferruginibacter sp.]
MLFIQKIPRLLRWLVSVGLVLLAVMTLMRFIFFLRYNPPGRALSGSTMLMGLRFDIKFICILLISMLVLCILPFLNPFKKYRARPFWTVLLTIIFMCMVFFYAVDYYYYDYLKQRLNASVLAYLKETQISADMVWETYPIIRVLLAVVFVALVAGYFFNRILLKYQSKEPINRTRGIGYYILFFLLFAWGIFGKVGQFNLRWSDAFTLNNSFKANLALNPFQSFFSTLSYRDIRPDNTKAKQYYGFMAPLLGVQQPDSVQLNYRRNYTYTDSNFTRPNIVVVICESFSMYKSSMSGNPLNTTPFFNQLCSNGVFFDHCFTPSYPTARGVWATVTSLPDVLADNNRTASRNPEVVDQHLMMNDFKGYEKFYFLGGDPTWANIKGMLLNNVDSLQIYSQENFKAKKLDVWGIDDKNLFLEANGILAQQQRPFFSIIQTADNHRPYSIPAADSLTFKKVNYPKDSLIKYGFHSIEELNAFRYTDFCFQQFIEAASKEKYFDNTIFVFVGDHGIAGNAGALYPNAWTDKSLSYHHVPLLFYAPKLLKPHRYNNICSQLDIMPSVSHLANMPHYNAAMGKDLFDSSFLEKNYAFIIDHELKTIGIVDSDYYYTRNLKTGKTDLVPVTNNNHVLPSAKTDSIKKNMDYFAEAYYQTARYLLYHNKK